MLEVVLGAGSALSEHQLLSDEPAEAGRKTVDQLASAVEVPVFLRKKASETSRHTARDDANLVRRVGVRKDVANQGVSSLVVRDDLLFLRADYAALALRPRDHTVNCFVELRHLDFLLAAACRKDGALIDEVRQVCP